MSFHVEQEFGHYRAEASMMSREDVIELAELLRAADSPFLRKFGIEIESELMETSDQEDRLIRVFNIVNSIP